MPSLSLELGRGVFGETRVDVSVDSDGVVVVDQNQVVETQVTSERDGYIKQPQQMWNALG